MSLHFEIVTRRLFLQRHGGDKQIDDATPKSPLIFEIGRNGLTNLTEPAPTNFLERAKLIWRCGRTNHRRNRVPNSAFDLDSHRLSRARNAYRNEHRTAHR